MTMEGFRFPIWLGLSALLASSILSGCLSSNLEENPAETPLPTATPTPSRADTQPGEAAEVETEVGLSWSQLMHLARGHMLRKEWDDAIVRLDQAELQVRALPPGHVRRRTVFSLQCRLAEALARNEEPERGDELAYRLFEQADERPEIAGPAFIELARSTVARLERGGETDGEEENDPDAIRDESLRLQELAFRVSQSEGANLDRLDLAAGLMSDAYRAGRLELAREAADQALEDARVLAPTRLTQLGHLHVERGRILLARQEFAGAEDDVRRSLELYEKAEASSSYFGIAEAALAEIMMDRGETDEALEILEAAEIRLLDGDRLHPHTRRVILAARARISSRLAENERARTAYAEALAIPEQPLAGDRYLVGQLREESDALIH